MARWLSEESLEIAEKKNNLKANEKRCTHLNAEFQDITRRYKKTFLSEQCKETEESSRIEKTRDLFKKSWSLLPQTFLLQ